MHCSVFIAASVDGFIATKDGDVDWLQKAGKPNTDIGGMDFKAYLASIDCMIMGRKTMEVISGFNLPPGQWPYGDLRIIVLSNTLKEAPDNLKDRMEIYSGEIPALISRLEKEGFQRAYIDGGSTITSFLELELINEMTITQAPILLGDGIPLFGKTSKQILLEDAEATAFPSDFVQLKYKVKYQ